MKYSLPKVKVKIAEEAQDCTRVEDELTVYCYFKELFKLLNEKLFYSVPRDEKEVLDLTKWINRDDGFAK